MDERVHGLPVDPPLRQGLDFLLAAHGLCSIARLNRLLDGTRAESSAEHSWHLALTALVLAPRVAPDVDLARVVEMIVLHDLVEVEAGDVPIYDEQARLDVVVAEQAAVARLFARLPVCPPSRANGCCGSGTRRRRCAATRRGSPRPSIGCSPCCCTGTATGGCGSSAT